MRHPRSVRALAIAALAITALAGCRKEPPQPVVPPPTASGPATTATAAVRVPAAAARRALGNAIGADNHIATPLTAFSSGDTIHASVETDGPARRLSARWTNLDSDQVVGEAHQDLAAGAQVTDVHLSHPDGWPTGRYRVEIIQDGNVVGSDEFDVR